MSLKDSVKEYIKIVITVVVGTPIMIGCLYMMMYATFNIMF